jgi:hypothetical protein
MLPHSAWGCSSTPQTYIFLMRVFPCRRTRVVHQRELPGSGRTNTISTFARIYISLFWLRDTAFFPDSGIYQDTPRDKRSLKTTTFVVSQRIVDGDYLRQTSPRGTAVQENNRDNSLRWTPILLLYSINRHGPRGHNRGRLRASERFCGSDDTGAFLVPKGGGNEWPQRGGSDETWDTLQMYVYTLPCIIWVKDMSTMTCIMAAAQPSCAAFASTPVAPYRHPMRCGV